MHFRLLRPSTRRNTRLLVSRYTIGVCVFKLAVIISHPLLVLRREQGRDAVVGRVRRHWIVYYRFACRSQQKSPVGLNAHASPAALHIRPLRHAVCSSCLVLIILIFFFLFKETFRYERERSEFASGVPIGVERRRWYQ